MAWLPCRSNVRGIALVVLLAAVGSFLLDFRSGAAQGDFPEPAFATVLNLTESFHNVTISRVRDDGETVALRRLAVSAQDTATIAVDVGADPVDFITRCYGCQTAPRFSLAQGQRIIVLVFPIARPAPSRSDLRVVNESGRWQRGAIHIGADVNFGRTLLPFNLGPGDDVPLGLRLPYTGLDFTLTCDHCDSQRLRIHNGVDLEVAIR